jgi:hypothetical protein
MGRTAALAGWMLLALVWFAAVPAAAVDLQWNLFRSSDHGFSIEFPGAPTLTSSGTPGKDKMVQYEFQVAADEDHAFEVAVLEFGAGYDAPAPTPDNYDKLIQGYAKGSSSIIRTQHPKTIAGLPGIEAISDDDKNEMHHLVDLIIANGRVYIVVSAGRNGQETGANADRFRDSFALIGK